MLRGDDLALKRYTIWGLFHFKDEETTRLVAAAADEDPLMIVPVALTLGRQDTEHSAQILGEWVQGTDLARRSAALRSVRQMKHPQGLALAREANRQAADLRRAQREATILPSRSQDLPTRPFLVTFPQPGLVAPQTEPTSGYKSVLEKGRLFPKFVFTNHSIRVR